MALVTIDAIGPAIGPTLSQEGCGRELCGTRSRDYDLRNSDGGHVYIYTFFRGRKLRSEETAGSDRPGVDVPMQAELSEAARSPRSGILLVGGTIGYFVTFFLNGREEPEAMIAATLGLIGLTVGIGFLSITLSSGGIGEHRKG
jgi:hypothetical protein